MDSLGKTRPAMAQALFDGLQSLACITGFLGQYLAVNAAFTSALGWTEHDLRGFAYYDLARPSDREMLLRIGGEVIRGGGCVEPRTYARAMRHKDGSYLKVEWTVWADPKNRMVYALGKVLGPAEAE
jgi:PAS domain S-box-containing protein